MLFGVARQTVIQALELLRARGLISAVKNRGSFVKGGADFVANGVVDRATRIINRRASDTERCEPNRRTTAG
ncbi:hypothetical protein ACIBG4_05735 [Nonomuraea sp. NPDC050383]|uniref:hypothetical protein n=1 Tax=Nonomuraea sp. NPDC050383 TaxID=3364362 RepID=UPI00378E3AFA